MTRDFTVRKHVHVSSRSFDAVVSAFEAVVGSVEGADFERELEAARDSSDLEARLRSHESTSGFMRFSTIDHRRLALDPRDRPRHEGEVIHDRQSADRTDHDRARPGRRPERAGSSADLRGSFERDGTLWLTTSRLRS